MAFLLFVSALVGIAIGWWAKRVSQQSVVALNDKETKDDVYTLKNKLDKCFDENASLHRDVKAKETQLNRLKVRSGHVDDTLSSSSPNTLHDKITALMDDLQLRDDTILTLKKEIEAMKS